MAVQLMVSAQTLSSVEMAYVRVGYLIFFFRQWNQKSMSLMFYITLDYLFIMSVPHRLVICVIGWPPNLETNILPWLWVLLQSGEGQNSLWGVQNRGTQVHALTLKSCGSPDPEIYVQRKIIFKLIPNQVHVFCFVYGSLYL